MNWKTILIRLAVLIVVIAAGSGLYAVTINILIAAGIMPDQLNGAGFAYALTMQASFVMMGSALAGLVSIFIRQNWRYALLLAPVYAPTIFAVIFTILHRAPAPVLE